MGENRNGCGNNKESHGFVRGLKKYLWMFFLAILGENLKKDRCPCGRNFGVFRRGLEEGVA